MALGSMLAAFSPQLAAGYNVNVRENGAIMTVPSIIMLIHLGQFGTKGTAVASAMSVHPHF